MRKVINPVMCEVHGGAIKKARGFCKIAYENGNLSITGVIGPKSNGNCYGSCGQCVDEIRNGEPVEGWTKEMVDKFCDIWDKWHLNDLRPYCQHQKELGWDKLARKKVTLYNYMINRMAREKADQAKKAALSALKKGETFTPTEEQTKFYSMPHWLKIPNEVSGESALYYEPKKPLFAGDEGPTETKLLGWLRPEEHPDGILCKPCPVCGYKYGSKWLKEDIPQDDIDWLFSLPDTTVQPAWV